MTESFVVTAAVCSLGRAVADEVRPAQRDGIRLQGHVARIRAWIKAKPVVGIGRIEVAPALPLSRIIWERKRKTEIAFGHRLTDVQGL